MGKFYGLTGTKLNIAIAVVAGTDFALFGYGEHASKTVLATTKSLIMNTDQGVMGGLLTLPSFLVHFPEIDTQKPPPGSSQSHAATIQAITGTWRIPIRL